MKKSNLTEIQKSAEWVRFARSNHALHGDSSSEAELIAALEDFARVQEEKPLQSKKDQ